MHNGMDEKAGLHTLNRKSYLKPTSTGEKLYVLKRRLKAFIYGIPFILCRIFPIQKNKIVLWTFEGTGGYGCSPRYIADELLRRKREGKNSYELYWILSDMSRELPEEIHKIHDTRWRRAYHMSTARYWIGNTRTFYGTRKRRGTKYIQTWHGSLSLKPIGLYRGEKLSYIAYLVSKADSKLIDIALSGSRYCTEMWRDGLIYDGRIETIGTPRCDVLIKQREEKRKQFRSEYGIPEEASIAIYAPTFRGGSQETKRSVGEGQITIDFGRMIDALEKRFGGSWYVFLRLHPQLSVFMQGMTVNRSDVSEGEHRYYELKERLIDVTKRPDMNEIMASTDAVVTDYSTCIFEGFLTGQPGFIYADDWDNYIADRGSLMYSEDEIPFPIARDNDELERNILKFDQDRYRRYSESFIQRMGLVEDGYASERVVKLIGNN